MITFVCCIFSGLEYLDTIQLYDYRNRTYSPKVCQMKSNLRQKFIFAARAVLYSLAAYCFIFSVWTYPVFIKNLIDYSRYLKADVDEVCVSELCKTHWLPKSSTGRLKGRLDYIAWYNFSKMTKFEALHLKGQSEKLVEQIFGKPTSTLTYHSPRRITYNYAPLPIINYVDQFQVHCKDGIIQSAEIFD